MFDRLRTVAELLFKQVPLLRIDGMNLVQSGAIARYLARKAHLYGETDADAAKYAILSSCVSDVLTCRPRTSKISGVTRVGVN